MPNGPGGSAIRKVIVPSRYRAAENKRSCNVASTTRGAVSASSPKRDRNLPLSISDSVASIIPPRKTDTSLTSESSSKPPRFFSDEELIKWSNQTLWRFLVLKSRKALKIQADQEVTLRKIIAERRDNDAWFKKWLKCQKSIDVQAELYRKLIALMDGEMGVVNLLRLFHDKYLSPVSYRLPLKDITLGDNFWTNLKDAYTSQEQMKHFFERHQKVLERISQQMSEIARVAHTATAWTTDEDEVVSKLSEASRLVLHLASLHAHLRQLEMFEKVNNLFPESNIRAL